MPIQGSFSAASRRGFSAGGASGLYAFTSVTFTAGTAGQYGNSIANNIVYAGSPVWASGNLSEGRYTGLINWRVPKSGSYIIRCVGSQGMNASNSTWRGGYGADIQATVSLLEGAIVEILCGKRYQTSTPGDDESGGGGGASFARLTTDSQPLVLAGGGGGAGGSWSSRAYAGFNGGNASTAINGTNAPPNSSWATVDDTNPPLGYGGWSGTHDSVSGSPSYNGTGAGGGWNGGGYGGNNSGGGGGALYQKLNGSGNFPAIDGVLGAVGGSATNNGNNLGGFGGGGGARNVCGAGGGGYTGGNASEWSGNGTGGGGGGGSYVISGATNISASNNTNGGLGFVVITAV